MERINAGAGGGLIKLGRRGENEAREVVFNISRWKQEYGDGVATLVHRREGDPSPYPCATSMEGEATVVWTITSVDTDRQGNGECELIYMVGNTVVKSAVWGTFVGRSLTDVSSEVPSPEQSWVDQVIAASMGKSAYEIAVENGFEGTPEEWLKSLVGRTPEKGVDYFTDSELAEVARSILDSVGSDSMLAQNILFGAATGAPFDIAATHDVVFVNNKDDLVSALFAGKCACPSNISGFQIFYPASIGFEYVCSIDSNGTVGKMVATHTSGIPVYQANVSNGYYYIPVNSVLYVCQTSSAPYEIFAKELLSKLSNTTFFKQNYYSKQQVDSIASSIRAIIPNIPDIPAPPDWIACYDMDLWLIDNDACMYKIFGVYSDENENEMWCTYPLDLPCDVSGMYGEICDFPVAIQYRTATMDANTRLFFRINEEGRATLYRDGEPDQEFYPVGYYYWGYLTDWSSFDLRDDNESDATGAIVLEGDESALDRETEETDLGEESAEGEQE